MAKITFINRDGSQVVAEGQEGQTVMDVALKAGIEIEAACEGSLACATCHLVVAEEWFGKLTPATDEEEDMLDLAYGLTKTSRLSCQLPVSEEMDGISFTVPEDLI